MMSIDGHGPTAREQAIIDLSEAGKTPSEIAERLNLSEKYVRQRIQSLVAPRLDDWSSAARAGSAQLLAALREHHPERCRVFA